MGLFRKKNPEGLRILSESEIRKKLYGTLLADTRETAGQAAPSKKAVPGAQNASAKSQESKNGTQELFRQEQSIVSSPLHPERARVRRWMKEEDRIVSNVFGGEQASVTETSPKPDLNYGHEKGGYRSAEKAFKDFAVGLGRLLAFIFAILFKLATSIDFRKKEVRQTVLVLGIILGLYVIFSSIHQLNLQRETAMKNPPRSPTRSTQPAPERPSSDSPEPSRLTEVGATIASGQTNVEGDSAEGEFVPGRKSPAPSAEVNESRMQSPAAERNENPYSVQVATYVGPNDAERNAARLMSLGLPAFVQPLERPGGKIYYCIFVGRFKTYAEADKALNEFRKTPVGSSFQDSFVRLLKKL